MSLCHAVASDLIGSVLLCFTLFKEIFFMTRCICFPSISLVGQVDQLSLLFLKDGESVVLALFFISKAGFCKLILCLTMSYCADEDRFSGQ